MARYACVFTSLEQSLRLKFKVLDAFLAMFDLCNDHDNVLFSMIPSRDVGHPCSQS